MTLTLHLPDEYGLVLAAATSTFFVNYLHFHHTTKARKASGIGYPNAYASAAEADKNPAAYRLNCAQRAHANFTENHTSLLGALLIAGLRYPVASAILGALWTLSRVSYVVGYTGPSGPKGRLLGSALSFVVGGLLNCVAAYTSFSLVTGRR